jgi:uncharacterized membrane protein YccF (DUF307 family)
MTGSEDRGEIMTLDPNADGLAETVAAAAAPVAIPPMILEPAEALAAAVDGHSPVATAVSSATIQQTIIVAHRKHGPGLVTRAVWYVFVGWWLPGLAITFAAFCTLSVILLPIAYVIINKIPVILTLRPRSLETDASVDADGTVRITTGGARQLPFWQRALWFVFVGWWACIVAMYAAYLLCLTIVLLPVGLMVFNRMPAVLTLQRN